MRFRSFSELRENGNCAFIECTCGAHFDSEDATEEAVHHVFEIHCFEEQVANDVLSTQALRKFLSPPVLVEDPDGGGQCPETTKA